MKTIESTELLKEPPTITGAKTLQVTDSRALSVCPTVIELTDEHSRQIEAEAMEGALKFGATEATLVMARIGLPTAIARIDCTIDPLTGDIFAYESDERPAGMGITDVITREILGEGVGLKLLGHLEDIFGQVPIVKRHPLEAENDDGMLMAVEQTSKTAIKAKARPILVRGKPSDLTDMVDIDEATANSVSTIRDEGRRQYRITTGHATLVTPSCELPSASFVVKTPQGSQATGVKVCLSAADKKLLGSKGVVSRANVQKQLNDDKALLIEKFVPGVEAEVNESRGGRMIMRIFCTLTAEGAKIAGGAFVARPNHIVHGASDAVVGAVIVN